MIFLLADDIARIFVVTQAKQPRVAEFVVTGPLDEAYLDYELWTDPVGTEAREADGFGEGRFSDFDLVELGAQVFEQFGIEAGADLAGEDEVCGGLVVRRRRSGGGAGYCRPRRGGTARYRRRF